MELHLGQLVSETHPLSGPKGHEVTRLVNLPVFEEPLWYKLLWLVPDLRVHVHGIEQRDDMGVLWNDMPIKLDGPMKKNDN